MNRLQKTTEMLLESVAYGDAAGVPVETKSSAYILDKYGEVDHLVDARDNLYFSDRYEAGTTSDDTRLTQAIIESFIKSGAFDIQSIAQQHVVAYDDTPKYTSKSGKVKVLGWGGSTTSSVEKIIAGEEPETAGFPGGSGNGVLMKMAPVELWNVAQDSTDEQRYRQYDALTTMTHDSDIARITTRVHGDILKYLLTHDFDADEFVVELQRATAFHEEVFKSNYDTSLHLQTVFAGKSLPQQILSPYLEREKAAGTEAQNVGFKYGFYAPETLALAYGAFLHGEGDFMKSVYCAVNMGGDADSTASIVGSMVNFMQRGQQQMPDDTDKIYDIATLRLLSRQFGKIALK